MQKLGDIVSQTIGEGGETTPSELTTNFKPVSPQTREAKKAVNRLFAWCKIPDGGDPQVYLAGAVGILAHYPIAVMDKIANPISGSEFVPDYPSLYRLRMACEKVYQPFLREEERNKSHIKMLPVWDKKLTEQDRVRRAAQADELRRRLAETLQPEPEKRASNAIAITITTTESES